MGMVGSNAMNGSVSHASCGVRCFGSDQCCKKSALPVLCARSACGGALHKKCCVERLCSPLPCRPASALCVCESCSPLVNLITLVSIAPLPFPLAGMDHSSLPRDCVPRKGVAGGQRHPGRVPRGQGETLTVRARAKPLCAFQCAVRKNLLRLLPLKNMGCRPWISPAVGVKMFGMCQCLLCMVVLCRLSVTLNPSTHTKVHMT